MRETPGDLGRLQALLDRSYAAAGTHLASIHTPERRPDAADLAERLQGMCLLTVATTTRDGRPLARPVDGFFYRGAFVFGSAPSSLLMRHLAERPAVSAVHLQGEPFGVTVHGTAGVIDVAAPGWEGFREVCIETYGPEWETWTADAVYARIEAERMFAFVLEEPA
jgi:hypothetical protein